MAVLHTPVLELPTSSRQGCSCPTDLANETALEKAVLWRKEEGAWTAAADSPGTQELPVARWHFCLKPISQVAGACA